MSKKIYLAHTFNSEHQKAFEDAGYNVQSPPDWHKPFEFMARGKLPELIYSTNQLRDALGEDRTFITSDWRMIGLAPKVKDVEGGSSGVLAIHRNLAASMSATELVDFVDEKLTDHPDRFIYTNEDETVDVTDLDERESAELVSEELEKEEIRDLTYQVRHDDLLEEVKVDNFVASDDHEEYEPERLQEDREISS